MAAAMYVFCELLLALGAEASVVACGQAGYAGLVNLEFAVNLSFNLG
ncbi:hypothetical protein [Marinobacter zhejiangensis]|nr:hypothetical protein [Marinobacter zhejiangensis]